MVDDPLDPGQLAEASLLARVMKAEPEAPTAAVFYTLLYAGQTVTLPGNLTVTFPKQLRPDLRGYDHYAEVTVTDPDLVEALRQHGPFLGIYEHKR